MNTEAMSSFVLGSEMAAEGRYEEAEAEIARALVLAPDFHVARYQLGLLQFSGGRAAMAQVTWQPLLALDDSSPLVHFVRGFAALAQDNFATAQAHMEEGLQRPVENAAIHQDIRQVLERIKGVVPETAATQHVLVANYGRLH